MSNSSDNFDYKNTLNLPTTDFPMKANLVTTEPKILEFWQQIDVYAQLQHAHRDDPLFSYQDGPPYANGDLHLGHAFNKILKDFVVKTKSFSGYKVPFIPGWDCHGLPIEIQVEKKLGKNSHQLERKFFIAKCREYAAAQVNNQRQQFMRLGIVAAWNQPYLTMDFKFEAEVMRVLAKILAKGHIVRGIRPVHWCLSCGSALAEAEVEYKEKNSKSIYVAFECLNPEETIKKFKLNPELPFFNDNLKISGLIWTTTPWTIPAVYGIALNANFTYCLLYHKNLNHIFIVAAELVSAVTAALNLEDYIIIGEAIGRDLEYTILRHPVYAERLIPIILGEHVTLDAGTGCVTTAPAHGNDDYTVGQKYHLPVINFIDHRGYFLESSQFFQGLNITQANEAILTMLAQNNSLLAVTELLHSYPHCWRHKVPIIAMATPQWFISMEKAGLRTKALTAVQQVKWIPAWGQSRIEGMFQSGRPDWCISRQRVWGVPIPFFMHKDTHALHPRQLELIEQVAQQVEQYGIEIWDQLELESLLGKEAVDYVKCNDIVDVWFESGAVNSCIQVDHPESPDCVELYLEGSDQHRGWFQSSLLISLAAKDLPPYKQVLTHGFILDQAGNKMSKSIGNVISPQDIITKYGAEVLRLWVATTDYSGDLKISPEILQRVSDGYRRIRNTMRFLLANLYDFDPSCNLVEPKKLLLLDGKILELALKLQHKILEYYEQYKYHLAYQKIHNFCVEELGSFYLDIIKDRQYTCPKDSIPRRSAQTALYYILEGLVRWIAPILSFTAEEIWRYIPARTEKSIFCTKWYNNWPEITNHNVAFSGDDFWEVVFMVKQEVNKQIEIARNAGIIKSNLEAAISIVCNSKIYTQLNLIKSELKFLCITSEVKLLLVEDISQQLNITITKVDYPKCARCWHRVATVDLQQLCDRCKLNLSGPAGEPRNYV